MDDKDYMELRERVAKVEAKQEAITSVIGELKKAIEELKKEWNKVALRFALLTGGLAALGGNLGELAKLIGVGG